MKKLLILTSTFFLITGCTKKDTPENAPLPTISVAQTNVAATPPPPPKSKCEIAMDVVPTFQADQAMMQRIFDFYKEHNECMDGMIAQTMADSVTKTLSQKWNELDQFIALIQQDPNFKLFILKNIDSLVTGNISDVKNIIENSSKHCSKAQTKLCVDIKKSAQVALKAE